MDIMVVKKPQQLLMVVTILKDNVMVVEMDLEQNLLMHQKIDVLKTLLVLVSNVTQVMNKKIIIVIEKK